eukprot:9126907-Ditylum_brightwellii.AAC.1
MACFMYLTKSCPHRRLTLVLAHVVVQLAIVPSRFVFGAIVRCNCLPSCESSLGLPFKKEVQYTCFVA